MVNVSAILDSALSSVDTPFQHQGRKPGMALDCVGLIITAGLAGGARLTDCLTYSSDAPDEIFLEQMLYRQLTPIELYEAQPGDVLQFRWPGSKAAHLGIMISSTRFVHARPRKQGGVVCVGTLTGHFANRLHAAWRFR